MDEIIREPKQKRAIEKKEKIIEAGFNLICKNGYYNTNTAQIAKEANVSTGIIYQYFKDKHDIFLNGLEKYGNDIFFPILKVKNKKIDVKNFNKMMKNMINEYIKNHKLSKTAHEEITAMMHSDKDVAKYFYNKELETTKSIKNLLIENKFIDNNLNEKVHIMIGMIDNLCHEVIYHKHKDMNYDIMTDIVINNIKELFKNDISI
ncbi:MAG: TetR/AcrR family transcriptional regulator [Bacilli bacterium]|nr:TetR/AcrR family transcriptional regulator [Bacilli bacterium]